MAAGGSAPRRSDAPPGSDSAFVRLWLGFATARVGVGLALVLLLALMRSLGTVAPASDWVLGMCVAYLAATLAVRLLMRPPRPGQAFDPQWVSSIGVDLLVFTTLQFLQAGGIYYAPLFAVPVLMAGVLGSTLLALATAAAVALLLLAETWVLGLRAGGVDLAQHFLQAGMTGTGFFALAFLAHQLAVRLAREEAVARASRKAAYMQAQVNQLVIDTLGDGVLVVDATGEVLAANPAAREQLGPAAAAPELRLASEDDWEPLVAMAERTFASGESQRADFALRGPGTAPRRMVARTRLTGSQPGDSLCVIFLQDLREMEARLRTEKLAAMGRMSTAVAHEIRNPLAAISQANELLEEELQEPAQRQLSALVRQNTQRLAQIVEDILDLARVQPAPAGQPPAALELDATVHAHCTDWAAQNRSGERLRLALDAHRLDVVFDPDHLRRVLVNLLDNALRYASARPDAIQVATDLEDASLTVWSDGPELDPTVESHLFEPFFSSESRSSGLGLYICRELCERHGASIGYRRGPAPAGDRRDGNAFFVAFRAARPVVARQAFARMSA